MRKVVFSDFQEQNNGEILVHVIFFWRHTVSNSNVIAFLINKQIL
jgi:hypothetical protein